MNTFKQTATQMKNECGEKKVATLKYLSTKEFYTSHPLRGEVWEDLLKGAIEDKKVYRSTTSYSVQRGWCCCSPQEEFTAFSQCSTSLFEMKPFKFVEIDDDVNCSEMENTLSAILLSEFEPIWFKLVHKVIVKTIQQVDMTSFGGISYRPIIKVTPAWWEVLARSGFLVEFMSLTQYHHMLRLLLLCGDVELNPGPNYKECCARKFERKRSSKECRERKEQLKALKELKKQEEDDHTVPKYIRKNVEMQMFSILPAINSSFAIGSSLYLGNKTRKTMDSANRMMEKLTSEVSDTLSMFRDTFNDVKSTLWKGLNVLDLASELVMSLIQVAFARTGCKIASLTIEIFRLIKRFGIPDFSLDDLRNLVYPNIKKDVQMQVDSEESFDPKNLIDLVTPTTIVSLIFVFLSGSFLTIIPKKTQVEEMLKRCGDMGRATKGIKDLNDSLHEYVQIALDYFREKCLHLPKKETIEEFVSGIDTWFIDVRNLLKRTGDSRHCDQILKDPDVIIEVENIYKRGLEFSREISEKKLTRDLLLPFQQHMKLITDLMKQVDTSGAFGTRPRTQPVVIWLFGESGVGKSGMSWPLAVDLNNTFVSNSEEARNFSKNIYMRNVEQEFWDNYQGQNIVIYDDFGQIKDTEGQPNMEFMELIRTANIAPYPLHMAHLEDKRKTRFTSKVLLLTSNVFNHSVSSLTFPDAFRRRIDLCARVYNKDEFTKVGYSTSAKKAVKRLDKEKVEAVTGDVLSTDVYLVDLIDPETGDTLEIGLEYEDFLDRAIKKSTKSFVSSQKMNEYLENYAEKRFKPDAVKRNVNMQIDDEDLIYLCAHEARPITEIEADLLIQGYYDQFPQLYDEDQNPLTRPQIALLVLQLSGQVLINNPDADPYELSKRALCAKIWIKENPLIYQLKQWHEYAMKKISSWASDIYEKIVNSPFQTFAKVLMVLFGLLSLVKFWNWMKGDQRQRREVKKVNYEANQFLSIQPYSDKMSMIGVKDLTGINNVTLEKLIVDLITPEVSEIVIDRASETFVSVAAHIANSRASKLTIYVKNRKFNHHGVKVALTEASVSGDPTTVKPKTAVLEAIVSGDPTTLAKAKPIVEAVVSGDPITISKMRPVIEASVSGDQSTIVRQAPKMLECNDRLEAEMQMWKDQVAQNIITNRIFSNLYKISKVLEGNAIPLLNGLFIRGNIMLVPGHLRGFLNVDDMIELRSVWDVVFTVPMREVKMLTVENALGEEKEAMLLVFPKYVSSHSDLVKHFSNGESMSKYKRADVCLPLIRYSDKVKKFLMMILGNHECKAYDREVYLHDSQKGDYILREGLEYKCPTIAGDCGAPVIVNETQVLRKIAGIHVAGDRDGMAYAESVTQKDLERTLNKIDVSLQISIDLDLVCKLKTPKVPFNVEFDVDALVENCSLPSLKVVPVGRVENVIYEPCKSELRPSLLYGEIVPLTTKPAVLRNVVRDGIEINVKHLNLAKNAKDTPFIDRELCDQAYVATRKVWLQNMREDLRRVLTWEETVCGSELSEYIGPMNRSSSPGYPWILDRTKGTKGKQGWFGSDQYILDEEVHQAVLFRVEMAKKGKRVPVLWVDTLKDERRPIQKVNALKTRVFNNGPMDFSLTFRMYYLSFIAHLMENRIFNEVSIGTNVYSQDWKKTVLKLRQKGEKVIAGDFSSFDGSLNTCIMERFADLANEFYDDGEENALIRKVLLQDVINSVHLCGDSIYMCTHSQPSGNPATTPLNCFVNSMTMRICYLLCAQKVGFKTTIADFERHVSMVSYGDDNVVNFSDAVCEWFNMETITQAYADIGFVYTDETKTLDGNVPKWRKLEQVAYLKRGFRLDADRKVWEAPLALETILEMPNWCRGSLDIKEGTKVNAENAIMELSMHDQDTFEKWSKLIINKYQRKTGDFLNVNTYKGYASQRYMDYYTN